MQALLDEDEAVILGVNAAGLEAGNGTVTVDRTLPWLQDTEAVDAWGTWGVAWRDVWVLDPEGVLVGIMNLTEHDLSTPENFAALRELIEAADD
jgi:hypothetical protein